MTDIDPNAIRHAFAVLEETAAWLDRASKTLRSRHQLQLDIDPEWIDLEIEGAHVESLLSGLETMPDNIRGAVAALPGREVRS